MIYLALQYPPLPLGLASLSFTLIDRMSCHVLHQPMRALYSSCSPKYNDFLLWRIDTLFARWV
ncbi:MAG TPA: hypothetical protein DEP84_15965 [Chloroflexi bacterium]|nr:hypothetical protein [Chloroflexota bacterium]